MLVCPSDRPAEESGTVVGSNYAGCQGDVMGDRWWASYRRGRGLILPGFEGRNSTVQIGGTISIATVSDGVSNTMMFSETVRGSDRNARSIKHAVANGGVNMGWEGPPSICAETRGQNGMLAMTVTSTTNGKGIRWGDNGDVGRYSAYNAALPPNSPSCANSGHHYSASSNHVGGVNVAMADDSVRFVNESIDAGDPTMKNGEKFYADQGIDPPSGSGVGGDWSGPSGYGVWGALATPNAGDTGSL